MTRLLVLLALAPALAFAEAPNDYAYGAPIATSASTPFQRIALPTAVYGVLTQADLRDLRVFNGAGEVVPHALEPRPSTRLEAAAAIAVALFPLPRAKASATDGLAVRVERRSDGTVVSVREAAQGAGDAPGAWLLDASQLKRTVRALELTPVDRQAQFAGRMRVEASDDLEHWRVLAAGAPLLVTHAGGQTLSRLRIEWPPTEARYWRLSWTDDAASPNVSFAGAKLEPAQTAREPARVWQRIEPLRARLEPGEYAYALPAGAPVDRLRVRLPQTNSVVPVSVLTRATTERDWRMIGNHTVYRLERDGAEVENPDLALSPSRELLLRFDTRGGGPGGGTPAVDIGWIPHTLVFAARGSAPFVLVYGSAAAKPAAYPIASLVPGYGNEDNARLIGDAALGEPVRAGGERRLKPQVDLKRWILWGVLGVAVLLLGWMAYRLWRQVGRAAADTKAPD